MDFFAVTQLQFQTDGLLTNFNKRSFLTPLLLILCDTFIRCPCVSVIAVC